MTRRTGILKLDNENDEVAKAGSLLQIDKGSYSDYCVIGYFVVLRDFKPFKELKDYLAANPKAFEMYEFEHDAFVAYLLERGYLLELESGELYLGSYQCINEVKFHPVNSKIKEEN